MSIHLWMILTGGDLKLFGSIVDRGDAGMPENGVGKSFLELPMESGLIEALLGSCQFPYPWTRQQEAQVLVVTCGGGFEPLTM